jgi:hypothetical protein
MTTTSTTTMTTTTTTMTTTTKIKTMTKLIYTEKALKEIGEVWKW